MSDKKNETITLAEKTDQGIDRNESLIAIVYGLACISGAAALIYEVAWARMLSLTFGSTTLATAAVVAGFMGGMGVGAVCYQLLLRRIGRPLLIYGILEIGIALSASTLTLFIYQLPELSASFSDYFIGGLATNLARFVAIFLILLLPSALMGATFPALCRILIQTSQGVDRHLGA